MKLDRPTLRMYVRRNLNMTKGKQSAQCAHAALGLIKMYPVKEYSRCVVLESSDIEFKRYKKTLSSNRIDHYIVKDSGKTEVDPGSETVLAFWEYDNDTSDKAGVTGKEASASTTQKRDEMEGSAVARKSGDT